MYICKMNSMDISQLVTSRLDVSTDVQSLHTRGQPTVPCRSVPRGLKRQRCSVVCFASEHEHHPRPPWHTLPIKHVLESQQFDKVGRPLQLPAPGCLLSQA